jgi:hypothetical protein
VTYGINLNALQNNFIWFLCNLENKIISVERILQYTSIPSEAPLTIKDNQPDHSWPSFGEVHIQDLQVLQCSKQFISFKSYHHIDHSWSSRCVINTNVIYTRKLHEINIVRL